MEDSKNNTLSISAFIVVLSAIVLTLLLISFSEKIDNLEAKAWACFGLSILGCLLGWLSFSKQLGKVAALLGSLTVFLFLLQLLRSDSGSRDHPVEIELIMEEPGEVIIEEIPDKPIKRN